MAIIQSYALPVHIDQEEHTAVFYETDKHEFDIRYGWAKYTSGMHSSLDDAVDDFLKHLRQEHPSRNISTGRARAIAEDEARSMSPSYELRRGDQQAG